MRSEEKIKQARMRFRIATVNLYKLVGSFRSHCVTYLPEKYTMQVDRDLREIQKQIIEANNYIGGGTYRKNILE